MGTASRFSETAVALRRGWAGGRFRCLVFSSIFLACFSTQYAGCGEGTVRPVVSTKLKVAATIFPLADIVRNIAKDQAEVETILPPGASPHTFQLTPRQIQKLRDIRVAFSIGRGLDDWAAAIEESLPGVGKVTVSQGIQFLEKNETDPHYWLSISGAKAISRNIAQELSGADPIHAASYQANLESYLSELDKTDRAIRDMLSNLSTRKIITFHNGWRYFARDYNLEVLETVEPKEGSGSKPHRLSRLADHVRANHLRVLFIEPGISNPAAQSIAEDLHLRLYTLDPIGGVDERKSFVDLMLYNARVIREALQNE